MPSLRYESNAIPLRPWAEARLKGYLDEAGLPSAVISSTLRTTAEQARIMVENYSIDKARQLYTGTTGKKVIAAWQAALDSIDPSASAATKKAITIQAVKDGIEESGYSSDHMKTTVATVDIAPNASKWGPDEINSFIAVLKSHPDEIKVSEVFSPGTHDAAVHFPMIPPAGTAAWGDLMAADAADDTASDDDESSDGPGVGTMLAIGGGIAGGVYAYKRGVFDGLLKRFGKKKARKNRRR